MTTMLASASARRYRTRNTQVSEPTSLPVENLLWRDVKVPRRRRDASVQLELLGPEELDPQSLPALPDPTRLRLERVDRTIRDTLDGLRPQLNRLVRELQAQLQAQQIHQPERLVVDAALEKLDGQIRAFVRETIAFTSWADSASADEA